MIFFVLNLMATCVKLIFEVNRMKRSLAIIFTLFILLSTHLALAESVSGRKVRLGHSYVCHFGKYGVVTIDTRDPGASITIDGVRHPANDGSYFYQTDDGKLAIAFNPKMTVWTYMSADEPEGITDAHCKRVANEE